MHAAMCVAQEEAGAAAQQVASLEARLQVAANEREACEVAAFELAEQAAKVQIDRVIEAAELEKAAAFGAAAEATARLEESKRAAAALDRQLQQTKVSPRPHYSPSPLALTTHHS